ncbi:MAG: type VI secretion system protein TssL, long form [Bradyrhizobium sp.]|uniref:type VI secretion system protein TssL, long form n=1 Tax=Bradyrhizobium sp. TaxID=376 RepID=UPI001E040F37|nr:type VI secretion system protein TssL, long form [Bradyrhizobium sp.]MBV9561780.1 type VI secretion system protein TssL, long form [Bradyrhizobium sp.]
MNDRNKPANPFGRVERTVIRPNPGGRLPQAPDPGPPQAEPGRTPPRPAYSPTPPSISPSSAYSPQASGYASPPVTAAPEAWVSTPPAPQPMPVAAPSGPMLRVDELAAPNANPIMRAAGPLLQLLGRLRIALMRASFAHLMEQVADAVKFFETDIRSAGISEEQANTAKYVLCATADDIVQHIPTDERHVWTQYSMLSRFFGERVGGVRFFEILDRLKADPLVNYPVLELQHACLALGFQGMHRTQPNGVASLQVIQRNLYETLRRVRPKTDADLSPHWRGQELANRRQRVRVPVWMVAAVVAALLMAGYFTLRALLSAGAENAAAVALALHPADPIEVKRRVIAPPPPPPPPPSPERITQLQRIRSALAAEKTACAMTADYAGSFIVIRVCDLILFESGEATVLAAFKPVAARVAATLDREPGRIKIVGHTDNSPMHTVRFPTNFELSVERAHAVAAVLKPSLTDSSRFVIEGKGPDAPIASNTTPEGRARNRRVEIFIERSE